MPSGNDSGSPTDYRISNPPPAPAPAPAMALISGGAAACATGAAIQLLGCLYLHSRPIVMLGFLLTLVGVGLVWSGLSKLRPKRVIGGGGGNPHGGSYQVRQVARNTGSPGFLLASEACPEPLLDTLYHLEANEHHECPKSWPVGKEVTFHRSSDGQALVSAVLLHANCNVVLTEPKDKTDGSPVGYGIEVTPLA